MVNVVPVITFPIAVFSVRSGHLFPFPRIGDFCFASLKGIAKGKAGTDDGLAGFIGITDTTLPVYDAV